MIRLLPQPYKIETVENLFSEEKNISEKIIADFSSSEAYELCIMPDKITAKAAGERGFYYADLTLRQLKMFYEKLPCMKIEDTPRYSHRGFMVDCARHMFTVEELQKIIDAAAMVKLNKFHWHLSDDQGFRIQLDTFPDITEKGSVRSCDTFRNCVSNEKYSGFYTKSEIAEIVDYCKTKFIDVIPELDMPGHLSALLHARPQYTCTGKSVEVKTKQGIFGDILCVGNEEARNCIYAILDEICDMFPYFRIHIGGDEVPKGNWRKCEKCQKLMRENGLKNVKELHTFFMNEIAAYLKTKGRECTVWSDCLKGGSMADGIIVQYWMHCADKVSEAANSGQRLILSPFNPFYIDYPYSMHSLKAVYDYEPDNFGALSDFGMQNIVGVESPVWTEFITNAKKLQYMCFPRWFAVAECGWTAENNKNYEEFSFVCEKLVANLNENGFNAAEKTQWNPSAKDRLIKTLSFFLPK